MKIIVDEFKSGEVMYQEITPSEALDIVAIRPHIYVHSAAVAGNITVKIKDASGYEIATSSAIALNTIRDAFGSDPYAHGYYKFDISAPLRSGVTYRVYIENSGYTYADNSYAGWCRDYDLRRVSADYSPSTGLSSAMDFEVWIRRKV